MTLICILDLSFSVLCYLSNLFLHICIIILSALLAIQFCHF
uniref:Uncharacterized protein n=1 Tax=Rhizophora mucronata TaxID=61149 RepID=A0A2P2QC74_RHIMU